MTHKEYLLACLAEECAEVGQAACKALRFGLDDKAEEHQLTNAEYLAAELNDVIAIVELLEEAGYLSRYSDFRMIEAKKIRVNHFMQHSIGKGTLTEDVD